MNAQRATASSSARVKGLPGGQLQRTTHAEMRTCAGPSRLILRRILRASAKHIPEAGGDEGLPSPALPWASLRAVAARPGGRSCMADSCRAAPWGLGRPLCLWDPGVGAAGGRRSPCHTSFSFRLCDVCVSSYMYRLFFIHPSTDGRRGIFHILATVT